MSRDFLQKRAAAHAQDAFHSLADKDGGALKAIFTKVFRLGCHQSTREDYDGALVMLLKIVCATQKLANLRQPTNINICHSSETKPYLRERDVADAGSGTYLPYKMSRVAKVLEVFRH